MPPPPPPRSLFAGRGTFTASCGWSPGTIAVHAKTSANPPCPRRYLLPFGDSAVCFRQMSNLYLELNGLQRVSAAMQYAISSTLTSGTPSGNSPDWLDDIATPLARVRNGLLGSSLGPSLDPSLDPSLCLRQKSLPLLLLCAGCLCAAAGRHPDPSQKSPAPPPFAKWHTPLAWSKSPGGPPPP